MLVLALLILSVGITLTEVWALGLAKPEMRDPRHRRLRIGSWWLGAFFAVVTVVVPWPCARNWLAYGFPFPAVYIDRTAGWTDYVRVLAGPILLWDGIVCAFLSSTALRLYFQVKARRVMLSRSFAFALGFLMFGFGLALSAVWLYFSWGVEFGLTY